MRDDSEDLAVADVMTRGVICVDVEDTVLSAAKVMEIGRASCRERV